MHTGRAVSLLQDYLRGGENTRDSLQRAFEDGGEYTSRDGRKTCRYLQHGGNKRGKREHGAGRGDDEENPRKAGFILRGGLFKSAHACTHNKTIIKMTDNIVFLKFINILNMLFLLFFLLS